MIVSLLFRDAKWIPAFAGTTASHVRVVRSAAAFGRDPDDVLRWVFDVAGFAVYAILRIDLQALAAIAFDEFVDARGAIALLGAIVLR